MGTDAQNEDVKTILNNKENFKAYIAMTKCQACVTSKIFKSIIESLIKWADEKNYLLDDVYNDKDGNDYKGQIDKLCSGESIGEKVPGFGIILNENDTRFNCKLSICLEATKNDGLYYGVYLKDDDEKISETSKQIKDYLNGNGYNGYYVKKWPFWKYINDKYINFALPDDNFAELLDKNYLEEFIEKIKSEFDELYKVLIESK